MRLNNRWKSLLSQSSNGWLLSEKESDSRDRLLDRLETRLMYVVEWCKGKEEVGGKCMFQYAKNVNCLFSEAWFCWNNRRQKIKRIIRILLETNVAGNFEEDRACSVVVTRCCHSKVAVNWVWNTEHGDMLVRSGKSGRRAIKWWLLQVSYLSQSDDHEPELKALQK